MTVLGWIVPVCLTGRESDAAKRAEDAGLSVWLPLEERTVIRRGRRTVEARPFWPGYFFASVHSAECIRAVQRTRGVLDVLRDEDSRPAIIRDDRLTRKRLELFGDGSKPVKKNDFEVGQHVAPKSGPLVHLTGSFCGVENSRAVSLISLFGREVRCSFKQGDLVAA